MANLPSWPCCPLLLSNADLKNVCIQMEVKVNYTLSHSSQKPDVTEFVVQCCCCDYMEAKGQVTRSGVGVNAGSSSIHTSLVDIISIQLWQDYNQQCKRTRSQSVLFKLFTEECFSKQNLFCEYICHVRICIYQTGWQGVLMNKTISLPLCSH